MQPPMRSTRRPWKSRLSALRRWVMPRNNRPWKHSTTAWPLLYRLHIRLSTTKMIRSQVLKQIWKPKSSIFKKIYHHQSIASFKEIATLITQTRSIGTLEPCKLIVANDCMDVSLMHNVSWLILYSSFNQSTNSDKNVTEMFHFVFEKQGCVPSDEAVIKELKKEHEDFLKSVS